MTNATIRFSYSNETWSPDILRYVGPVVKAFFETHDGVRMRGHMLIDTGCARTLFDERLLRAFGLRELTEEVVMLGVSGQFRTRLYEVVVGLINPTQAEYSELIADILIVGGLPSSTIMGMDMDAKGQQLHNEDIEFIGILGRDFLSSANFFHEGERGQYHINFFTTLPS